MSKKRTSFLRQKSNLSQQVCGVANFPLIAGTFNPRPELAKIKSTPTDPELDEQVVRTEEKVRI